MKRNGLGVWGVLAVGALLSVVQSASALMTQGVWGLDQSNTFADGVDYGTVRISADSSTGDVTFELTVTTPASYGTLNKFGIQKFGFNHQNLTSSPDEWTVSLPANWSQDDNGGQLSGFGRFAVSETTSGANNRLNPLVFTIRLPTPSEAIAGNFAVASSNMAGEGNQFFAAHVAGFSNGGSHYIAGSAVLNPIPEPTTLGFFAAGLGMLGIRRQ